MKKKTVKKKVNITKEKFNDPLVITYLRLSTRKQLKQRYPDMSYTKAVQFLLDKK